MCVFVCVFSFFRAFLGSFLALGAGRRAALFSVGLFVCVFVCVFSFFRAFLGSFLATTGAESAVLRLFSAVWGLTSVCRFCLFFSFFMKAVLSFF